MLSSNFCGDCHKEYIVEKVCLKRIITVGGVAFFWNLHSHIGSYVNENEEKTH